MDFSITLAGKQTVLLVHLRETHLTLLSLLTICSSLSTPLSLRFTSAGFCCVAHLRSLAIEDYILLGICSAEECSRLSKLIRNLKVEQVSRCGHSDYEDCLDEGRDHGYFLVFDDNHGVYSLNDKSLFHLFLQLTEIHWNQQALAFPEFDRQGEKLHACNSKSGMEYTCVRSPNIGRSPNSSSTSESKSRPKRTTNVFSAKLLRQRDRKGTLRKQKLNSKMNNRMENKRICVKEPIYELKRTVNYNYGLPLSSFPSPENK